MTNRKQLQIEPLVKPTSYFPSRANEPDWTPLLCDGHSRSRGTLRRKGVQRSDIEDAQQDVAVRLLETFTKIHSLESLPGYVYRIAQDVATSYRRHYARFPAADPQSLAEMEPRKNRPQDQLDIEGMISLVPDPEERRVLELRFVHGYGRAEVAELLGVTERTVKYLQASAIETLRRHFGTGASAAA